MISLDTAIVLRFQPYPLIVEATLVDTKTQDAKRRRGGVLRAVIKRVKHRHKLSVTTSIINEPQTRIQISCETQTLRQTFLVLRFLHFNSNTVVELTSCVHCRGTVLDYLPLTVSLKCRWLTATVSHVEMKRVVSFVTLFLTEPFTSGSKHERNKAILLIKKSNIVYETSGVYHLTSDTSGDTSTGTSLISVFSVIKSIIILN